MSRTRYASHPLVLDLFIYLAYLKWIDLWFHTIFCGPPQSIGSFLCNSKLKLKNIGLCKILRKISDNAYVLEPPEELGLSSALNVAILYKCE